ncbi:hypothetical protein [Roseateles sp. P5_E7]
MSLSAEDLLLAGGATHRIAVPARVLDPAAPPDTPPGEVVLRPLRLAELARIAKAAKEDGHLTGVLMVQQALVEPAISVEQANRLHAGLVQHLLLEVNRISGLAISADELEQAVQAPLAKACFTLAREFGWTAEQCANLSVGQVLLYLEMAARERR